MCFITFTSLATLLRSTITAIRTVSQKYYNVFGGLSGLSDTHILNITTVTVTDTVELRISLVGPVYLHTQGVDVAILDHCPYCFCAGILCWCF